MVSLPALLVFHTVGILYILASINHALLTQDTEWPCWGAHTCWVLLPFQGGGTWLSVKTATHSPELTAGCFLSSSGLSHFFLHFSFSLFSPASNHMELSLSTSTPTQGVFCHHWLLLAPDLHTIFHFVYFRRVQCHCHRYGYSWWQASSQGHSLSR